MTTEMSGDKEMSESDLVSMLSNFFSSSPTETIINPAFISGKPWHPSLFSGKAKSLSKKWAPERFSMEKLGSNKRFILFGLFIKPGLHYGDYRSKLVPFEA